MNHITRVRMPRSKAAATAAMALSTVLILGACSSGDGGDSADQDDAISSAEAIAGDEDSGSGADSREKSGSASDSGDDSDSGPGSSAGSDADNPLPAGSEVEVPVAGGTMTYRFGKVNWDANTEVEEASRYNRPPKEGETYAIVPVTMTFEGLGKIKPDPAALVFYHTPDGEKYRVMANPFLSPKPAVQEGEMADGDKINIESAFTLPKDAVGKGVLKIDTTSEVDSDFESIYLELD